MRTRILAGLVLAVLCIALSGFAADYYHLRDYVTTKSGYAVSGAYVYIYDPPNQTSTTATAYTDLAGTSSVTYPLTTDSNGMFECYIADGNYDIRKVHSGWLIDDTWDNYMVGARSGTLSFVKLEVSGAMEVSGTMSADAFDAADWIDADGEIRGATLKADGVSNFGGLVTAGGSVEIAGSVLVTDQAKFAWDAVEEEYSVRIGTNMIGIEPLVEFYNHVYVYGDVALLGKDSSSGTVSAQTVESDTLKPRTGSDLYARSATGKNDAVLHLQFLQFNPIDITGGMPDTSGYALGTLFYASDDSFRYLAGAGISKRWRALGHTSGTPGADNPELDVNRTSIHFTYAEADGDTSTQTKNIGITNLGDGILLTTSTEDSDWIGDFPATTDTFSTAGGDWDSLAIRVLYGFGAGSNTVAEGGSYTGTVTITSDYGTEYITVYAEGDPITGEDYVVEPNHPRLFFNEDGLATLQAKCKSAESARYNTFLDNVDWHVTNDSYPVEVSGSPSLNANTTLITRFAFAYAVEQDTTYLAQAVECIDAIFTEWPGTWQDDGDMKKGLSLFYDWCYNGLGSDRRSTYGDSLGNMLKYEAPTNYTTNAAHSQIVVISPMMYMALALDGDGIEDVLASAALDSIYAHTFGDYHMCAILDSIGNDGGGYEGDYSEKTLGGVSTLFWMWDYGTDKAPWATSSNMVGWGDYLLYDTGAISEVTPLTYGFTHSKYADDESHASGRASRMLLANRLATVYSDSVMTWLSDQYDDYTSGTANSYDYWKHIVVQDTVMTALAPNSTSAANTSAKQFDVGTVFMREGWDNAGGSTDVWATYRHEQFPWGHAAADAGHFVIGRGHDLLFIRSGEYDGCDNTHHNNYQTQTVAHNAITVKRSGASFDGYANSGGQYLRDYDECGIDGPLTVGAYYDSLAAGGDRGSITDYAHRADTLTYIRSDLTDAYSASTVDTVRREFVWMEPDGVFLIFDYADVDSVGYLQKSLLHIINTPVQDDDFEWTVTHGTSEAKVTFYNADSSQALGGAGSEFMVNGTNYPPSGSHSDNGAYRIEALMARDTEQRWLLTVVETSVVGGADYGTVSYVEVGDYIGAIVNSDTLLFHKYGGSYEYREGE